MTDDAHCLRRYADSRDEAAFAEFVHRNVDLVYAAAYRQVGGDRQLAEDIVQKVFISVSQKASALSYHPVIAAWLHQATRYAAIDLLRVNQRRQTREALGTLADETVMKSIDPVRWDQVSPELDKLVAALSDRERTAVVLRFFGGKSFAEIGRQLELSENAARMRVDRALEKLRSRLSRSGITSTATALAVLLADNAAMAAPAPLIPAVTAAALAAPVATGLAAGYGTFLLMTSTKITATVATLVALASLVTAFHEYRRANDAEAALARASDSAAPRAHPVVVEAAAPTLPNSGPVDSTRPVVPNTPPAKAKSALSAVIELFDNPLIQKQNELQARGRLDVQYGPLFKALGLTPDQVDQFKNLLVEKQMAGFDSMSAAHQQGIEVENDPKAFFTLVAGAEKFVDAQIAALLGTEGFDQFQQYQATLPARNTVNLLAQALSYTATPLSDAQLSGTIQLLTQYGSPALPPGNPFAVFNADLGLISLKPEGLTQLQTLLAPAQIKTLQTKLAQQNQLFENRKRMGH